MIDSVTVSKREMLAKLRKGMRLGGLTATTAAIEVRGIDALVEVAWNGREWQFAAELKARRTPRAFDEAVRRARDAGTQADRPPMIILPYLNEAQLESLEKTQASGIDLSGNGVVVVPGELYVYCSGKPNRYRDSTPTKYAYRGATSLVPRVFLCRPRYERVMQIQQEIETRGARVTLSTVSKALKRMEEDALVTRRGGTIRLLQADALLDKLLASYQAPKIRLRRTVSTNCPLNDLFTNLPKSAAAVVSGASSAMGYVVAGREGPRVIYCRNIDAILEAWGARVRPVERFADLELQEADDDRLYFDAGRDNGAVVASPVQSYLELATGDKRDKQAAQQVRERILKELEEWNRS